MHAGIDELGDVLEAVKSLSARWRIFCVMLRIKEHSLELIEQNHSGDSETCLYKALGEWLRLNYDYQKHGRPSWRRLAEAVWSMDKALFEKIVKDHAYTSTGEGITIFGKYNNVMFASMF